MKHPALNVAWVVVFSAALVRCGSNSLTLQNPGLTKIEIAPSNKSIAKGQDVRLSAMGVFSDGSQKSLTNLVAWQVNPASVAVITPQGDLSGVGEGTAQVTATYEGVVGTDSITVGPALPVRISVSAPQPSLPLGESEALLATGTFSDGTTQDLTDAAKWQTSPPGVASVSAQGQLKALSTGVTQVSATYEGVSGTTLITVASAALLRISVTAPQLSLPVGESEALRATGTFSDGTTQDVTDSALWQTSPSGVASVSAQGQLKALRTGVTQVSATYQGVTGSASLTAAAAALQRISVSAPQPSLPLGESESLLATGTFSDGTTQDLTDAAKWQANPSSVASVSALGQLKALSTGITQVSATYEGVSGTTSVTVARAALLRVGVTAPQISLPVGESETLSATGTFSDGTTQDVTDSARWQANPSSVASVSAQGQLKALSTGVTQVSATYEGVSGSASVTVARAALLRIGVTAPQTSLPLGESESLHATGSFSDGTTQDLTQSVVWNSSNSSVASVNSAGAVAAKAMGTVTVSAVSGSLSGTMNLTITPAVIIGLKITPAQTSLLIGNSLRLRAIATFSDGTTKTATGSATWISEQPGIVSVASRGTVTAEHPGSATILATMNGISGSASLTVMPLMLVSYFNRANASASGFDSTLRLTNPGFTSGDLCAMVYVFNENQVLSECCGCRISDNGLLTLSLIGNLTSNPLTEKEPTVGTIQIAPSDAGENGACNAGSLAPDGILLAWQTNVQTSSGAARVTEIPSVTTVLGDSQAQFLATECAAIQQLGSGAGACSCGTE